MKLAVAVCIGLGITLSGALGVEYQCEGEEIFPFFYGTPFIHQRSSLATSMQWHYSVIGVFLNTLVWTVVILLIAWFNRNRLPGLLSKRTQRILIVVACAISTISIGMSFMFASSGFSPETNYWSWDLDEEASRLGMKCDGTIVTFVDR